MSSNLDGDNDSLPLTLGRVSHVNIPDSSRSRGKSLAQFEQFNDSESPWFLVRKGEVKKLDKRGVDVNCKKASLFLCSKKGT